MNVNQIATAIKTATEALTFCKAELKECGKNKGSMRRAVTLTNRIAQFETIIANLT